MPEQEEKKKHPDIMFACYTQKSRSGEQFIAEHSLGYNISGTMEIFVDGKTQIFKEGELRFCRRNRLARFSKEPAPGGVFKSVTIFLGQQLLRSICAEHQLQAKGLYCGESALLINPNPLFRNYMASLTPYLDADKPLNKALTALKVKEAVMILMETNPALQNVLFDFNEPGKIDLEAYMTEHYKFNVDLNRYAYLTGRSLATFKRDFEKIFNVSPNKWLQQQRLKDAYFLISEKGVKVSDVYLEVGFKDLSHFSFAFKKTYGITPSKLSLQI